MANYLGVLSARMSDHIGILGTADVTVQIPDTATLAQIATDVAGYVATVDPVTGAMVYEATLRLVFPGSGGTTAVGDIEKGANFNLGNATTPYATGFFLPDIATSVLTPQGLVDLTNVNVQALITWLTTAHTAITVVTKGLQALTRLIDVIISFRKHRKPLSRKTKEA